MEQLPVVLISVLAGIFGFVAFSKMKSGRDQKEMQNTLDQLHRKEGELAGEIKENERQTQEKVDEITKEQNNELNGQSLADWFNRRKGK